MVLVVGSCAILDTSSICGYNSTYYRNSNYSKMCEEYKVGEIQGHDVIYIPSKDVIFCKNTAVKFSVIEEIIRNNLERNEIPEKNLTIVKDNGTVSLGCLTTTMANCLDIRKRVRKQKV